MAKLILEVIANRMELRLRRYAEQVGEDNKRNEINQENIKLFEAASNRADQIQHAIDLLNGVRSPKVPSGQSN